MSKICKECGTDTTTKWLAGPTCRKCYKKKWYEKNREREACVMSEYYKNNADKLKTYAKEYYEENKETILKDTQQYKRDFYHTHKEQDREYRRVNKEKIKLRKRKYWENHRDEINEKRRRYLDENLSAKIASRVRTRVWIAIKNKNLSLPEYLGCSIEELKSHLESLFTPGMSWENYGKYGWHIDHIVPISIFDLTNPEELRKACHYTNLQPLWWRDNIIKGARL
jgi:hypothetical protein